MIGLLAVLNRLRARSAERSQREATIKRVTAAALEEFQRTRRPPAMAAHVLRIDADEAIVRVMFLTDHVPPDRAWFAVSLAGAGVRELSFGDVAGIEGPWR